MRGRVDRRQFFRLLLAAGVGGLGLQRKGVEAAALETCHWLKMSGHSCDSSGRLVV